MKTQLLTFSILLKNVKASVAVGCLLVLGGVLLAGGGTKQELAEGSNDGIYAAGSRDF